MSLPEDTPREAFCSMEGHDWRGGGVCVRCGEQLRCGCGQFVRDDDFDAHLRVCRWALTDEGAP